MGGGGKGEGRRKGGEIVSLGVKGEGKAGEKGRAGGERLASLCLPDSQRGNACMRTEARAHTSPLGGILPLTKRFCGPNNRHCY